MNLGRTSFIEMYSRANNSLTVSVPVKAAETEHRHLAFATTRMERRSTPTRLLPRPLRHRYFSGWMERNKMGIGDVPNSSHI